MTVSFTRLDGKSGGPLTLSSNNITPGDNKLIFAFVMGEVSPAPAGDPTFSGGGLTWNVAANNVVSLFGFIGLRYKVAWAVTGTGSGTFAVTADFGATAHNIWLILDQVSGADKASPIVQTAFGSAVSSAILSALFSAPMGRGNGVWGGAGWLSDAISIAAGDGYSLLTPAVTFATAGRAQTLWRPDPDGSPNVDAVAASAVAWGMTGIEVKAALHAGGNRVEALSRGRGEKLIRSLEVLGRSRGEKLIRSMEQLGRTRIERF